MAFALLAVDANSFLYIICSDLCSFQNYPHSIQNNSGSEGNSHYGSFKELEWSGIWMGAIFIFDFQFNSPIQGSFRNWELPIIHIHLNWNWIVIFEWPPINNTSIQPEKDLYFVPLASATGCWFWGKKHNAGCEIVVSALSVRQEPREFQTCMLPVQGKKSNRELLAMECEFSGL